jgi:LSD1 subclass zinc finger protein
MGNINKTFVCSSCKKGVHLTSEGDSFICPHCQTTNMINKSGNPFIKLIVFAVLSFLIYPAITWWANREADREINRIEGEVETEMERINQEYNQNSY